MLREYIDQPEIPCARCGIYMPVDVGTYEAWLVGCGREDIMCCDCYERERRYRELFGEEAVDEE